MMPALRVIGLGASVAAGVAGFLWLSSRAKGKKEALKVHAIIGDQGGGKLAGWSFSSEAVQTFKEMLPEGVQLSAGATPPPETEVLIGAFPSESQLLECRNSLQSLVIPFAGLPPATRDLLARLGMHKVSIHNVHHNSASTAEMAIALCLAAAKQILPVDVRLRQGDWTPRGIPAVAAPDPWPQMILNHKCAVVLGYGHVGKRVSTVLSALGCTVHAIRATCQAWYTDGPIAVHPVADLHTVLTKAMILVICLPGTAQTEGLIGKKQLSLLPKGSVLVNVGRGHIVDEASLYEALASGERLFAAGLDCWYNYPSTPEERSSTPVSKRYDFGRLDNVVMSPHRAGGVGIDETEESRLECIAELIDAAFHRGSRNMPNRVAVEKGY